jgi:hypothetical protein
VIISEEVTNALKVDVQESEAKGKKKASPKKAIPLFDESGKIVCPGDLGKTRLLRGPVSEFTADQRVVDST